MQNAVMINEGKYNYSVVFKNFFEILKILSFIIV